MSNHKKKALLQEIREASKTFNIDMNTAATIISEVKAQERHEQEQKNNTSIFRAMDNIEDAIRGIDI